MNPEGQPEGELYHDLGGGVMVADVALPGVGGEEEPASHPVGQDSDSLLVRGPRVLLLSRVEVEQHPLLLHCHQALVQPGTVGPRVGLPPLHQVLAPDGHLEAAVDDLTSCPEVLQDLSVILPSWRGQGGQEDALKYQN